MRNQGRLVCWVTDKLVNVINLETLGVNSTMMTLVAEHHCANTKVVKAPAIDFLKAQVQGCILNSIKNILLQGKT